MAHLFDFYRGMSELENQAWVNGIHVTILPCHNDGISLLVSADEPSDDGHYSKTKIRNQLVKTFTGIK